MKKKRILSISYEESILRTRQYILEQAGFEVVSACGFAEALELCGNDGVDLIVLGHTLPPKDKTALIAKIREHCGCPVLSIRRSGIGPHPDADYSVSADEGPEALVIAVRRALQVN